MASQFQFAVSLLSNQDILELLRILSNEEDLSVTITESTKGAVLTGLTTLVGGIFLGPPGFALGGAVGGLAAYRMAKHFKPVSQIFCEMSEEKQDLLCRKVKRVLLYVAVPSVPKLLSYVNANTDVHDEILKVLKIFVTSELGMSLKT